MKLKELQANWDAFGKTDPLYAILTLNGKEGNGWDINEFFERGEEEINGVMDYVRSLGIEVPTRAALDFGCGVGRLTQALAHYFESVSGVDIAPSMIELAWKYNRHGQKCNYVINQRDDLGLYADDSFDFIYSNITLQHMSPRHSKKYIREFIRILSPGGLMIFQLPSATQTSAEPTPTIRDKVRDFTPAMLRSFYHRLKYGGLSPVMQMYAIKKAEVIGLLEEGGARIVDVTQESMGEEGWVSLRYCADKARPQAL